MKKFTPFQAIIIRERLVLYYNDLRKKMKGIKINGLPSRASIRELLQDIIYSEFTDYSPIEGEMFEDKPYDYYFDLKDDTLGAFISRRQDRIDDKNLLNIANFLLGNGYLDAHELQIFREIDQLQVPNLPKIDNTDYLSRAPLNGEYVSLVTYYGCIDILSFKFSKKPRQSQIRVVQKDFEVFLSGFETNDNSIIRQISNRHYIQYPISHGICIFPKKGLVTIILFSEDYEVELCRIDVNSSRNEFKEITRNPSEFCLLANSDNKTSKLFLAATKNSPIISSRVHIAHSYSGTRLPFPEKRDRYVKPFINNETIEKTNSTNNFEGRYSTQVEWDEQFINAAKNLDFFSLIEAMGNGANLSTKSKDSGNSALHWAAIHRSRELYAIVTNFKYMQSEILEVTLSEYFKLDDIYELNSRVLSNANGTPPIAEFNNEGLLPSNCIPYLNLDDDSALGRVAKSLFLEILSIEYKHLRLKPEDFIDLVSKNDANIAFPNIVRFIEVQ
ncbi:MAG: hypothetical protein J0L55_14915 [Caulobacterales bacterium]|nr:hypothetical protein [Caulobacterales bacterium]